MSADDTAQFLPLVSPDAIAEELHRAVAMKAAAAKARRRGGRR